MCCYALIIHVCLQVLGISTSHNHCSWVWIVSNFSLTLSLICIAIRFVNKVVSMYVHSWVRHMRTGAGIFIVIVPGYGQLPCVISSTCCWMIALITISPIFLSFLCSTLLSIIIRYYINDWCYVSFWNTICGCIIQASKMA
jgi:hypothetical protein